MGYNYIFDDNDLYDENGDVRSSTGVSEDESNGISGYGQQDIYGEDGSSGDSGSIEEPYRTDRFDLPATSWGCFG